MKKPEKFKLVRESIFSISDIKEDHNGSVEFDLLDILARVPDGLDLSKVKLRVDVSYDYDDEPNAHFNVFTYKEVENEKYEAELEIYERWTEKKKALDLKKIAELEEKLAELKKNL